MLYAIARHPLVEADLLSIGDLISNYSGLEIAQTKVDEIVMFAEKLRDFPHIGTIRSDIHPGLRAIPASDKAVICFTVDEPTKTIYVICVSYGGADWQQKVRERS